MKKSWIIILLILFSLISFGQPGGGQYTIWIYVTFDGSPINNATVKVTNLANGQSDYATYEPSYGDGWYGINLANNIDWDYGDVVLIEAFYNDYYGSNTTVLTTQDYSIVNVSIISSNIKYAPLIIFHSRSLFVCVFEYTSLSSFLNLLLRKILVPNLATS